MSCPYRLLRLLFLLLAGAALLKADDWMPERPPQCGIRGHRIRPSYAVYNQTALLSPAQCGALCNASSQCRSISLSARHCRLYAHADGVVQFFKFRTYYDKVCNPNRRVCGIRGRPKFPMLKEWGPSVTDNSWSGCRRRCQDDVRCQSFSIGLAGRCRLYRQTIPQNNDLLKPELETFWDLGCEYVIEGFPGFHRPIYRDRGLDAEATETPQPVTRTLAEYVPYMTDSPPYVATKAVAPHAGYANEEEFIKSHTYTQYNLPPLAAEGTMAIAPTAAPKPTWAPGGCMISTGPWANFTLVDQEFVPIVWQRSDREHPRRLVPLPQPHGPPPMWDPLAGLDPLTMPLDSFYLQVPPHVPDKPDPPSGVFDMLYSGDVTRHLAMQPDGEFVLVDATALPGRNLTTSMFRVDCEGLITLEVDGRPWAWTVVSELREPENNLETDIMETRIKAMPGNPDPEHNYFRAVSTGHWISQKARGDNVPRDLADRHSDAAPKCPQLPGRVGLAPHLLEENHPGLGNLCTNMTYKWRNTLFDFTRACDIQSRCYDRCDRFSWESCNDLFIGEAITYCFNHWARSHWDIVATLACTLRAKYYGIYLSSQRGKALFAQAQKGMCSCSCAHTNTTATCPDPVAKDWYCADVGEDDDKNCGACGRTCGPGTVCRKGRCALASNAAPPAWTSKTAPSTAAAAAPFAHPDTVSVEGQCYVLHTNDTLLNGNPDSTPLLKQPVLEPSQCAIKTDS
ncbi:hypothetical protein E4U55_005856 [Claviceps digitariae]|nr:hypothetical protein E4U55_005856 [Claviceps digitariae]